MAVTQYFANINSFNPDKDWGSARQVLLSPHLRDEEAEAWVTQLARVGG